MSSNQQERKKSKSGDSGLVRIKEAMPSDVAGTIVDLANDLARNHETLKFRMEVINPNGARVSDCLRQLELTVEPVDKNKKSKQKAKLSCESMKSFD